MSSTANIISASRRTDIPRFYARWFSQRRKEGWAEFRNSFGGKGAVSLRDSDVIGYLFWTRYAKPFVGELRSLLADGLPCVFQYTLTGYGRWVEHYTPHTNRAMDDFLATSNMLPAPECIQWRYDPIVICEEQPIIFHLENFENIASALQGATRVANTSFMEPYAKSIRIVNNATAVFRRVNEKRKEKIMKKYPHLIQIDKDTGQHLLSALSAIARKYGMDLRMCCDPEWEITKSQCCGPDLFAPYGEVILKRIGALASAPSRESCRCLKTVDIGMDNTCIAGCKYCYAVTSHDLAMKNYRQHCPDAPMLRRKGDEDNG